MSGNKTTLGTGKIALTCSSILGLALGMGSIAPAQAALIITNFSDFNPNASATYALGGPVDFGPSYDPAGFTAQGTTNGTFNYFNLTGNGGNTVAVFPPFGPPGTLPCSSNCSLKTFTPGQSVDGNSTFASSGSFKTNFDSLAGATDGNFYFGLSDNPVSDPYGWLEITLNSGDVTLDRFAFEEAEGVPAPIPVPEPLTLSLFAVGGAAVLAARRRKRAQTAA